MSFRPFLSPKASLLLVSGLWARECAQTRLCVSCFSFAHKQVELVSGGYGIGEVKWKGYGYKACQHSRALRQFPTWETSWFILKTQFHFFAFEISVNLCAALFLVDLIFSNPFCDTHITTMTSPTECVQTSWSRNKGSYKWCVCKPCSIFVWTMPGWDILNGDIQTFFPLRFKQLGAPTNTRVVDCDAFERLDCREKGGSE